jgi:23S rRNA pseudouridine2605 synthase
LEYSDRLSASLLGGYRCFIRIVTVAALHMKPLALASLIYSIEQIMERLHKILAQAGLGSRRKCESLITSGRVSIDGKRITKLGQMADPAKGGIYFDGEPIKRQKKIYYLLNKPRGFVCTNVGGSKDPRAIDLLSNIEQRVYTVGRLDKESEGLIIITNDGELANLLSHPRYGIEKTYLVEVKGRVTDESILVLKRGIWISEGKAAPASVKVVYRKHKHSILELVLREGKNREIRRILAQIDHPVVSLKRIKIGPLKLNQNLKIGKYRRLSKVEVESLYSLAVTGQLHIFKKFKKRKLEKT